MITTGKRYTPKEIERYVDAVTPEEIQRVAQKYLWDKDVRFLSRSAPSSNTDDSSLWLLLDEPRVSSTTTESELVSGSNLVKAIADILDMSSMIY